MVFVDTDYYLLTSELCRMRTGTAHTVPGGRLEKEYGDLDADTRKAKRLETGPAIWEAYWSWIETVNPVGGAPCRITSQKISPSPMR